VRLEKSQAKFDSAQLRIAALKNPEELEDVEKASEKLAADLEKETRAREAAQNELAEATATVEELTSRNEALADLEVRLEESQAKFDSAQLRIAALKNPEELEEVEKASEKLAADLEKETRARETAQSELAKATAMVEELSELKQELLAAVRDLNANLRVADERAIEVYVLEKDVTDLKDKVEKATRKLGLQSQTLADLGKQLEASQNECELLRRRVPSVNIDEDIGSEEAVTVPASEVRVHSSPVVAKFEQSLSNIPVYQALREYDPAFYDGLIISYKQLVGQDLTDKQVNDALRAKQAELMERLLPRASDDAIIAYARLIVDQLDELQLDGIEPCLTLLVPQSSPDKDTSPIYSERTKGGELDTLELILRTHDVDRQIPAEKDIWPDLGPIFAELFEAFGADNVAALENSYDPSVDRVLVCNVSRALYSGILNLPKRKAANALRWLLST